MKILLLISTLLLLVSFASAGPFDNVDKAEMERFMKTVNNARNAFAKKYNIANMHELEFDYALAAFSESLGSSCYDKNKLLTLKQYEIVPVNLPTLPVGTDGAPYITSLANAHLMNPVQIRIGYGDEAERSCKIFKKFEYNTIYVLGHENKEIIKHGAPGSQCKENYVNKDGLCVKKA